MTGHRPPLVFLGTPRFAAAILEGLVEHGWKPGLVVTERDKPIGRQQILTPSPVRITAEQLTIPVTTPETSRDIAKSLQGHQAALAVVAAYGKILSADVINTFPYGMVNVHASLLPTYRGASPIQAAILNGDTATGITFMRIEPSLDTGPILAFAPLQLAGNETTQSLTDALADTAASSLPAVLDLLVHDVLIPMQQDDSSTVLTKKIEKSQGEILLSSIEPQRLDRMLRAYTPWPGIYTNEFGVRLLIKRGRIQKNVFCIEELQWEGKRPVDGETFARAYPDILTSLPETIRLSCVSE